MAEASPSINKAKRIQRFLLASGTYAVGFLILALCTLVGLFPKVHLLWVAIAFLGINIALYFVFLSDLNLRFKDPSLTKLQVCLGAFMVCIILILGDKIHFLAVPFYSSLFVFAMLQLNPREMVAIEVFVLLTYCAAVIIRRQLFEVQLDPGVELVYFALVVSSSVWYAAAASYISSLRSRLRKSVHVSEQLAIRDGLTNLWNRRHIEFILKSEIARKSRLGGRLCVCLVDLDHFKSINDKYGHPVGDMVLRNVALTMQSQIRSIDQLGRFGGEEFLLVFPGATLEKTKECARRLLNSVAELSILPDPEQRITISLGLAEADLNESIDTLLARVDKALYQAKHAGRNQVILSTWAPLQ
jgi:diguanylate cyclase (GGDEF)-like protein